MGEEHFPTLVAPKHFQAQQRLIALGAPELTAALEAALKLTAGRFDGSRANGLMAFTPVLIFHPLLVVLVVFEGLARSLGGGLGQMRLELFQLGDDLGDLIVADLFEQGLDPLARLLAPLAMECISHRPEIGVGVPEIQPLDGVLETVFHQVPNPDGAIGQDQHPLGLGQAARPGLVVDLLHQGFDAATGRHVAALGDDRPELVFEAALLTAVAQPETGGSVNPMPTVEFGVLTALLFRCGPSSRVRECSRHRTG